jgi:hypothetical protein
MSLLKTLAKRGRGLFLQNPYFPYGLGIVEMSRGPHRYRRRKATPSFEMAVSLHENQGGVQLDDQSLAQASRFLQLLESPGMPQPFDFGGNEYESEPSGPVAIPPGIQELLDELGVGIEDLLASALSGESPEEFIERHGGKSSKRRR